MSTDSVPWQAREGWTDVVPIAQAEAANPLVPINYSPEYISAMSTFRYILKQNEMSKRVLDLTSAIVKLNPAHYTVWAYRSKTLLALKNEAPDGIDLLVRELAVLDDLVRVHLKNYQVWQHRRIVVTALGDPSREIGFTTRALAMDAKNYHTWAYRQWALSHFYADREKYHDVWQGELDFVNSLLVADVRNNSAWNHRWFVLFGVPAGQAQNVSSRPEVEIDFTKRKIEMAPNNPSAWNYLRGIIDRFELSYSDHLEWAQMLQSPGDPTQAIPLALEFLADAHTGAKNTQKVHEIYLQLATSADPMRRGYWDWKSKQIRAAAA